MRLVLLLACLLLTGCHHRTVTLNPDPRRAWVVICVQDNLFERRPILAESDRWCPKHQNAVLVPDRARQ